MNYTRWIPDMSAYRNMGQSRIRDDPNKQSRNEATASRGRGETSSGTVIPGMYPVTKASKCHYQIITAWYRFTPYERGSQKLKEGSLSGNTGRPGSTRCCEVVRSRAHNSEWNDLVLKVGCRVDEFVPHHSGNISIAKLLARKSGMATDRIKNSGIIIPY